MRPLMAALILVMPTAAQSRSQPIAPLAEGVVCPPSRGDLQLRFKWLGDGAGAIEETDDLFFVDYGRKGVAVIRFDTTPLARGAYDVRVKIYVVPDRGSMRDEAVARPAPPMKSAAERFMGALLQEYPCG